MKLFKNVFLLISLSLLSVPSYAYEQPPINLGFTSFLDGAPPAGKGWYFTEYVQLYSADDFTNSHGDNNSLFPDGKDPDLDVWVSLSQFIYQSDQDLLGAKWGIEAIVPYVDLDLDFKNTDFITDNDSGLGDIVIGPYLQWDPIMGKNGPIFMHRLEFQFILPTGKYDDDHTLNPGSNFFSFNPYWSGTLFVTPKLTASTRIHYLWNAKNDDPGKEVPPTLG